MNNTVQIIQDTNYVEEESGKPVSFSMYSDSSGEKTKISGEYTTDNEMSVDFDINGVKTSKDIKLVFHAPQRVVKLQSVAYPICFGYLIFPQSSFTPIEMFQDTTINNICIQ